MSFDKIKVVRAAEKHLAQGKIPAAIKEYNKIVDNDPDDLTALNMLGDLYARASKKKEAIGCFTRIAQHYRELGFALKAIAMFKKIDRLEPGTPEIASNLAVLYEAQGLIVDARAQYLVVADAYSRSGQVPKALEVLRKVADLDSSNTEIRLKLAEGYLRERLDAEAAEAFTKAGAQFLARGAHERALDAYSRALKLFPRDHAALNGLASTHIARGTAYEAAEVLERALAEQPNNTEILALLVRAFVESDDAPGAERVAVALAAQEASNYVYLVDVARLYLKNGDAAATRVLTTVAEQMLAGRDEHLLIELVNEALARDPEQVEALRLLVRIYTWQRDDEKLRVALERLAEVAEAANLVDVERSALSQLTLVAPDRQDYLERLCALGVAPEDIAATVESESFAREADQTIPTFESFTSISDTAAAEVSNQTSNDAAEFEWNTVSTPIASESASFADLKDDPANTGAAESQPAGFAPSPDDRAFDFSFNSDASPVATALPVEDAQEAISSTLDPRREALLQQELGSVDFYIAQGYTDIALDTLNMLEGQFGAHAEIVARREKLKSEEALSTAPAALPSEAERVEFAGFTRYDVAEEAALDKDAPVEIDNSFAEFGVAPPVAAATIPTTSAPGEFHPAASATAAPGLDPGLAAIFDEFRAAVEEDEPAVSDGDYETHYNLGIAYKEMDLVDEAVEEFQIAAGLVAPQDGTPRYLQCCNLLGHCFMQKNMPQLAVMWFKKGLDVPGRTEDEYQALRFELGAAYEKMGDTERALQAFTEVYGVNVSYRGVAEKVRSLQAQKTS